MHRARAGYCLFTNYEAVIIRLLLKFTSAYLAKILSRLLYHSFWIYILHDAIPPKVNPFFRIVFLQLIRHCDPGNYMLLSYKYYG